MIADRRAAQVRGTQTLVDQMGWMLRRPEIVAIEVGWRWLFGVPFLLVCWARLQHVLGLLTLEDSGLHNIDVQNPWIAAAQLSRAFARYEPLIAHELKWLVPIAALAWIVISGLGRSLAFYRMDPRLKFRPASMMMLQTVWLALFGGVCAGWFLSVGRAAQAHFPASGEPDLIGFAIWLIFLSLAFFTVWALLGWIVSVAPVLMLFEKRTPLAALGEGLRLGKTFTSELVEIGMVMGIVNLALMILAMVLSAAPLPFSDQLGGDALHMVWAGAVVFYLIAHDYFQLVRLKCFIRFWMIFRGEAGL
ncbi:hypothetical protein P8935_20755 [Telmatobacter sp. DSM 110680]|uniref:Uncharacterized protein n=1 Tax=Telmatobacter sp. DSM 110680 TaxID=3036704 RepID=A0AAU7DH70_9BACT